jgi:hypothetical protein
MDKTVKKSSKPTDFRRVKTYYAKSMKTDDRILFRKALGDNKKYNQIGILSYAPYFYKYMSLDVALQSIRNGNIMLVEPSRWQDKYERRFYEANYDSQTTNPNDCPLLFSTCVTTSRFNEAAWKLYTYNKAGLGAYCVEFQINKHKFRCQLAKAIEKGDAIYEGVVMYCSPSMIDNIHHKSVDDVENKHYQKYVQKNKDIPYFDNYLNLLLMKRLDFQHEKETRFFILKKDCMGQAKAKEVIEDDMVYYGEKRFLDIDWVEVIEKVYINISESSLEYTLLSDALKAMLSKSSYKSETEKKRIWEQKLKPVPYFVYGETLSTPLVIE